jgi:DeoR/GlpR family transcriptional regulator of sugar metabolism
MTLSKAFLVVSVLLPSVLLSTAAAISAEQEAAIARDALETVPVGYGIMMDAGSTGTRIHVYRLR